MTVEQTTQVDTRPLLDPTHIAPGALRKMSAYHEDVLKDVARAVADAPIVVVGMKQNPFVKKVRKALGAANLDFQYLEYGSYLSKWKERLAIKLWSGWPTFPQVFVRGVLLGGEEATAAAIADGTLRSMLDEKKK
jgi:monothiol glutaredoxin